MKSLGSDDISALSFCLIFLFPVVVSCQWYIPKVKNQHILMAFFFQISSKVSFI